MSRPARSVLPAARRILGAAALLAGGACASGDAAPADTAVARTAGHAAAAPARDAMDARLDSALARLRAGLLVPTALVGGERSRDALVRRFVRALETADTSDLRRMMLTRTEFAHLYYPGSAYTRRPTRQEADLVWFLHIQDSQKGVSRALARYGARPLGLVDYACAAEPVRDGASALWHGCVLRVAPRGDTAAIRLFGPIIERGGQYKIHTFANDL